MGQLITLSIYKDGNQWFCSEGTYPECTNPHEHIQGYGNTEPEAVNHFMKLKKWCF